MINVRKNILYVQTLKPFLKELYLDTEHIKAFNSQPWVQEHLKQTPKTRYELAVRMAKEIRAKLEDIRTVEERINAIEKPIYREILRLRYMQTRPMSLKEIAEVIGKSESWTRHLHQIARKEYEKTRPV